MHLLDTALTKARRALRRLPVVGRELQRLDALDTPFPVGHYYHPVPDWDKLLAPAESEQDGGEPSGIEMRAAEQLTLLEKLAVFHAAQPFPETPAGERRYWYRNNYFSYSDGIVYHTMLRHTRPARIIEVGSGFSSALALDTDDLFLGGNTQMTFIDPNPERLNSLLREPDRANKRVIPAEIQSVDLKIFRDLQAGDILFIDTSHVTKAGNDVNHIYFKILPIVARGVLIHVHDVFWPWEYPRSYLARHWAWNELYLLRAMLTDNHALRIVLFPSFLEARHGRELQAALPLAWTHAPGWPDIRGASIWLEKV